MKKSKVALIGYGYWGEKLAKVLHDLGVLRGVFDISSDQEKAAAELYRGKYKLPSNPEDWQVSLKNFLIESGTDSVAIATPPDTHYEIAMVALLNGCHVFVEKPFTTSLDQARILVKLAEERKKTLRVGHVYLHSPAWKGILRPVGKADLYVKLLNVGGPPGGQGRDLLWAGIPHGVAMAYDLFRDKPICLDVRYSESRMQVKMSYWNGSTARIDVGDYAGVRMRLVELREGGDWCLFNADHPDKLFSYWTGLAAGERFEKTTPLELELREFIEGTGVDPIAIPVMETLERIKGDRLFEGATGI